MEPHEFPPGQLGVPTSAAPGLQAPSHSRRIPGSIPEPGQVGSRAEWP